MALTPHDYWQCNVRLLIEHPVHLTLRTKQVMSWCIFPLWSGPAGLWMKTTDVTEGPGGDFHNRERSDNTEVSLNCVLTCLLSVVTIQLCCQFKIMLVITGRRRYTSQQFSIPNPVITSCLFKATAWGSNYAHTQEASQYNQSQLDICYYLTNSNPNPKSPEDMF